MRADSVQLNQTPAGACWQCLTEEDIARCWSVTQATKEVSQWITQFQSLINPWLKVLGYVTAHLNTDGDVYANASGRDDFWLTNSPAAGGGRLLQDFGEFTVATVDLFTPPPDCNCLNMGRAWYKQLITENLLGLGFAGWMADFGEYTPISARSRFASRWWGEEHGGEILHQGRKRSILFNRHFDLV